MEITIIPLSPAREFRLKETLVSPTILLKQSLIMYMLCIIHLRVHSIFPLSGEHEWFQLWLQAGSGKLCLILFSISYSSLVLSSPGHIRPPPSTLWNCNSFQIPYQKTSLWHILVCQCHSGNATCRLESNSWLWTVQQKQTQNTSPNSGHFEVQMVKEENYSNNRQTDKQLCYYCVTSTKC